MKEELDFRIKENNHMNNIVIKELKM